MYFFLRSLQNVRPAGSAVPRPPRHAEKCALEDESPMKGTRLSLMVHFNLLGLFKGHWGPNLVPNSMSSQAIFNH